nr:MAG TPA: tail tape measure [Caudoviricetes sp.]
MSDNVVTELVIDADTTGADAYARAMDGAEQAASKGLEAVSGFNLGLAAFGISAAGAVAGVQSLIDWIEKSNRALADMALTAKQTGLSLDDFQAKKFAANVNGVSDDQYTAGLQKSASLLNDAQRNANSLTKIFDENGLSIKNANGQLITQNQLLSSAANLVAGARTQQDAIKIAEMLGFTKEWVPLLQQGSGAMQSLADEAQGAGLVIDSATIEKAAAFDAEWQKSSVLWSTYMKAAAAEILPIIDELIGKAQNLIPSRKQLEDHAGDALSPLADALDQAGIAPKGGVVTVTISDAAKTAFSDLVSGADTLKNLKGLWGALPDAIQIKPNSNPNETIPGYAASQVREPDYPSQSQMDASFSKYWKALDAAQDADQDASDAKTKIPSNDTDDTDQVDRAINSLRKHTEQQIADTQAVGLGSAALAGFRADAALTAAVQANGGEITKQQAAQFAELKTRAVDAAEALARAKVSSDIQFSSGTSLLGSEDVKIATQLKGIYGNDIPAALDSSYAAAIRFNDATKEVSSGIENNLVTGLTNIETGSVAAGKGFSDMGNAVIKTIEQMITKILIVEPLMRSLQMLTGGGSGIMSFLGLGGSSAAGPTNVFGAAGAGFAVPTFAAADGGTFGPGWGVVGERGPELIKVHDQGVTIVPNEISRPFLPGFAEGGTLTPTGDVRRLAPSSSAGEKPSVTVNVVNNTGVAANVEQSTDANGDVTIVLNKLVDQAVGKSLSDGTGMRVLAGKYGVQQFAGS